MYRPERWQNGQPVSVIINFPGVGSVSTPYVQNSSITAILPQNQTFYAFDAVLSLGHEQEMELTRHPVQSGSSITDHAYIQPARLTLDVGMSDAIDSYEQPDTWSGSTSKSVSAYQTMLSLQRSRIPLSLTTRLRNYSNMLVVSITPNDTSKTFAGLRMTVVFEQIILASINVIVVSSRPQDTGISLFGSLNPVPPSSSLTDQNNISGISDPAVPSGALGSGNWSSSPSSLLTSLPGPR